jgi:hypothetical protein
MVRLSIVAILITAVLWVSPAPAVPVQLVPGTINMFRDMRGLNDVAVVPGDRFQFGASIVGGSAGATLGGVYPPTGFTVSQGRCTPLTVNPNTCSRTTAFNLNRLEPWTLRFDKPGFDRLEVTGPPLVLANGQSVLAPVPFPTNVTLSGSGLTPTIAWTVPGEFTPDGFRVQIWDKGRIDPVTSGVDIIHSVAVSVNATSYMIPATLSSGLQLAFGGNYTINFQLIETRNHVAFTNNNAQILRRSNTFFAFSPLDMPGPPNVFLPTVVEGVYNFMIAGVGPTSVTFIDPFVAVGYDYAIGAGDPPFASVLLPDVGDGQFTLAYLDGGTPVQTTLAHDAQFFFPPGGVSAFRVTGIEVAAGLDPNNVTAFITGLTFVTQGNFTGTMTPLTVFVPDPSQVPEPATLACVLIGVLGLAVVRWRQGRRAADK